MILRDHGWWSPHEWRSFSEQHVLIVCNYFRTPFPRPWQYRPPVALLGKQHGGSWVFIEPAFPQQYLPHLPAKTPMLWVWPSKMKPANAKGIDASDTALPVICVKTLCTCDAKDHAWPQADFDNEKRSSFHSKHVQVRDVLILKCWNFHFLFTAFSYVFWLLVFSSAELHEPVSQGKPDGWSWKVGRSVLHRLQWNHW